MLKKKKEEDSRKGRMKGGGIGGGDEPWGTMDSEKQTEGSRGEGVGGMGIKEGTYWMEHWVLYANNESWNTTSKNNDVMYGG